MALSQAYLEWERQTEQRGVQQGAQQEARSLVLRLLSRHDGLVPESLQEKVNELPIDVLESLGDARLDFASLSELEKWLQAHSEA